MITTMLEEMEKAESEKAILDQNEGQEATEMKDMNKDKLNVVSETQEETATSV